MTSPTSGENLLKLNFGFFVMQNILQRVIERIWDVKIKINGMKI